MLIFFWKLCYFTFERFFEFIEEIISDGFFTTIIL